MKYHYNPLEWLELKRLTLSSVTLIMKVKKCYTGTKCLECKW